MTEPMLIRSYLAYAEKGVHLHVLDFPGCFGRGTDEASALTDLQAALQQYFADLHRHGEIREIPAAFDIRIVERSGQASGPFDPGDTAALFEREKAPIETGEIDRCFRLADGNRADLIVLAGALPDRMLDWTSPQFDGFTIRKILRHIGNGEKWYVSRILSPEEEPAEWDHDRDMPVYEYLDATRRTCRDIYRALAPERLDGRVLYPAHHTSNPAEAWNVRKSLRRMLEHEREHTAHILEVIDAARKQMIENMVAASETIRAIAEQLTTAERTGRLITGSWTLREVVGHLTDWEKLAVGSIEKTLAGLETHIMPGFSDDRIDTINAEFAQNRGGQTWEQVWDDYSTTRAKMVDLLSGCSGQDLARVMVPPWGGALTLFRFFQIWPEHDLEHVEMIRRETDLAV